MRRTPIGVTLRSRMSTYENYDRTSQHYDHTRVPVGGEIIVGCLAGQRKPLHELEVLDAGCGTGAYTHAIIGRVGRVVAVDMSRGMVEMARTKLRDQAAAARVGFLQGSIAALPFAAESFDAVMINQVLHHLDDSAVEEFPAHRRVIGEFARVLRRGGALLVNSCSQQQLRDGRWYPRLIPRAADSMRRRFVPLEALHRLMADAGFVHRGDFVPVDAVCQGATYFDGRGPLSQAWRDGDSLWALADDDELARAQARVRKLDRAGRLESFVAEHDARRPRIGQITFSFATRA